MQVFYPDGRGPQVPQHPLVGVSAFTVKRRVSLREQYYEIRPLTGGGGEDGTQGATEGDVALYASQKQVSLPEEYRFSADRGHTQRWLTVRARTHMNLGNAVFEAFDERAAPAGWFQYQWLESQVRHTWRLVTSTVDLIGHQAEIGVGAARVVVTRHLPFGSVVPIRYGFDSQFRDAAGQVLLRVQRRAEKRDRYVVTTPGGRVDARMAVAMTVLMDWRGEG